VAAAKLADSRKIKELAARAEARGDPGPASKALRYLAQDGEHIGIVVRVEDEDGAPAQAVADARAWLVWLLQIKGDDGRFMVLMVSGVGELSGMRDVEVTDEFANVALEFAREDHVDLEFDVQGRAQGLRLVSLVAGEPGLCVRCRTSPPAVTDEHVLLAPEGPVCAGCLNLTEQITWGEAALAALRKAGAHDDQIAAVEREVAELRAQLDAGPT
jgi:hypothetical protein